MNSIKHYSEILSDARVLTELAKIAPPSPFSGKPLSITRTLADQSDPLSLRLIFENSLDPDWWVGQQDGVYGRQHREEITPDQIEAAAIAAGLDRDEVIMATTVLRLEINRSVRDMNEYILSQITESEELRCQKSAEYAAASVEEKREMLYNHFVRARQLYGRRGNNRRKTLRKQLQSQIPPETFNF